MVAGILGVDAYTECAVFTLTIAVGGGRACVFEEYSLMHAARASGISRFFE